MLLHVTTDLKALEPGACVESGVIDAIIHYFIKQGNLVTVLGSGLYATIDRVLSQKQRFDSLLPFI